MIIKRRFRPLGKLLQRFGRGQINNYTHTTNMASRAEVPPVWEDDAQQPLVWSEPDAINTEPGDSGGEAPRPSTVQRRSTAQRQPAVQRSSQPAPAPQPAAAPANSMDRPTPPDLWKIHDLHTQMLEEEGYRMPPSPWAPKVDPATASRLPAPPSGSKPAVQRRAQTTTPAPDSTPASRPANVPATPAPPTVSSRRRGRVIEEITPPQEGEEAQASLSEAPSMPDDDSPTWETELETAEDRPDLFEALMSEGVVQRRHDPDLSNSETFAPTFRRTPQSAPVDEPQAPPQTRVESTPAASSTPNVQRSAAAQPPRTEPGVSTPPQTPPVIQGSAYPAQVQRELEDNDYYAEDEADLPPSLVPAPGTTEADLLDMLGLPADTPVRGLNPAAAMPTDAPASPASPPAVQRTEASAAPTPSSAPRVNVPPASPYQSPITGEPITPDAVTPPSSPANPSVMRQADEAFIDDEPAASDFADFFEAAEAENEWTGSEPVEADAGDWAAPAEPTHIEPGESLPRGNPFPLSNPPAALSSSAPTRPTPRVQRAEAEPDLDLADDNLGMSEIFSEFDDTQPIELPDSGLDRPISESGQRSDIQRAAAAPAEPPGESYPRTADPAYFETEAQVESLEYWSDNQDMPVSEVPQATTPRASRPVSSGAADAVQREEAESAASAGADEPTETPDKQIGYRIEGLRTPTSDRISRVLMDPVLPAHFKFDGKTAPEGMSMELPSKTSTDSVSSGVTAPSSGGSPTGGSKTTGGSTGGSKTGSLYDRIGSDNQASSSGPSGATTGEQPVDQVLTDSGSSSSSTPTGSGESSDAPPDSEAGGQNNVDKLAREVYNLLRDRLRVEQERRPKR